MADPGVEVETLMPFEDVDVEADVQRLGPAPEGRALTDGERRDIRAQQPAS